MYVCAYVYIFVYSHIVLQNICILYIEKVEKKNYIVFRTTRIFKQIHIFLCNIKMMLL